MALNKLDLIALINGNLPDNTTALITPEKHRQVATQGADSALNVVETAPQTVAGEVDFTGGLKNNGADVLSDAPSDGGLYTRRNGEWVTRACFIATTNANIAINNDATAPSFLPLASLIQPSGVQLVDAATGAVQNISGRTIAALDGTVSFNPDVSGGTRRLVLVSEISTDGGASWTLNANSIRKIEITGSSESFKTVISFLANWPDQAWLRFRAFNETGGTITLIPESDTILGQAATGPSYVWALGER